MQSSNVENLSPQVIRHVTKELYELTGSPPEGIRVTLNDEDITDIQAMIEGPGKPNVAIVILFSKYSYLCVFLQPELLIWVAPFAFASS